MSLYVKIVEGVVLPLGDALLGTNFIRQLKDWRKIQWYTADKLQQIELDRLYNLLKHASRNVKYYRALKIPENIENAQQWLKSFPILYKKDIKVCIDDFVHGDKRSLVKESSSGSSGIQGEIYMSKKESSSTQALQTLLWEWSGYRLGKPILQLGMTTHRGFVKQLKDIFLRTNYQQAFNLQSNEINNVLASVQDSDHYFGGYASGLYVYAQMAKNPPEFKAIISWGDKIFPHYRKKIETVFNSRIFDTYGCTEGFVIAGQCEAGSYHILSPHVKVELVNEKGEEVEPGEPGYVLITRLDGFSMPLIRYYLGDIAVREFPEKKCSCGRCLPMLRKIIGRDTDVIKTRSGKMLIVHFFTGILEFFPAIKQFRIVQENLESITLEYIPEEYIFKIEILDKVRSLILDKAQENLIIQFKEVKEIKPTPSGKPQIIKSLL